MAGSFLPIVFFSLKNIPKRDYFQLKIQRNQRDRVESLTFLSAVREIHAPPSIEQLHENQKTMYSNNIEMFWKVLSLGKRMYWFQHVSSFLSEDLSVSTSMN